MPERTPITLCEFHQAFPESVRWRVTPSGIEIENAGLVPVSEAARSRCLDYLARFAADFACVSHEYRVADRLRPHGIGVVRSRRLPPQRARLSFR
jgi:hypothetical protein